MPSSAFTDHLVPLLKDAEDLEDAHSRLKTGNPGRQFGLAALNRAAVVMCISAWEAYVEELMRESLTAIRPFAPPLGVWPALNASVRAQLGRFNTPNVDQVRNLLSECLGLPDVQLSWTWFNCTPQQAAARLNEAMRHRHEVAHGVNPRPVIHNKYASQLPDFFRRLAQCTDDSVRAHVVNILGIANPWPP